MLGREKKSEVLRYQICSKDVLTPDETELYELTQLAGITMDPSVFKILLDLLKVNVAPMALDQMLRLMCDPHQQRAAADIHSLMSTSADSMHSMSQSHSRSGRSQASSSSSKTRQGLGGSRSKDSSRR